MGYKDAEWATKTQLPMKDKVVLIAVCLRTNDRTHETFVGQQTIADMIGSSRDKVGDALGVLTRAGIIVRNRRSTKNGYRTSDTITVNVAYAGNLLPGKSPTRQKPTQETEPDLSGNQPEPMPESSAAKEINQMVTQGDHSDTPTAEDKRDSMFEQLWPHWPRKAGKDEARRAFRKIPAKDVPQVARAIIAHGAAYAQWPKPDQQFVKHLSSWLNAKRWQDDELPLPRNGGTKTDAGRAAHEELMRRAALDPQKELTS